jgi:O-antigen/teichoic acid export membrane protein
MAPKSASAKILHNSFWYGLEQVLEVVVFFGTNIAVARYLGKTKLGAFAYINFIIMTVNTTCGTGLAGATRKYMAEFIGKGQPGISRAVYHLAFRYQLLGSIVITSLGLVWVRFFSDPNYRTMAYLLVLSMTPGLLSWVPAQANQALEDVAQNTLSSLGYIFSYAFLILLTLHFHWDLVGVAAASLVGRTVEAVWRILPLHATLRKTPRATIPDETLLRIRNFFFQAMGITVVNIVVYGRSEVLFLHHYGTLEQIAFYSVSVGLAGTLLKIPQTFASSTGITLMVESARDPRRVDSIVQNACRYLFLLVFPLHLGAAVLARQAIALAYGPQYAPAAPVLTVAVLLAMFGAFMDTPDTLIRGFDKVHLLLRWLMVTAVVTIGCDWALIPHFGAVGAAWGNGLGQAFGIVALWVQSRRFAVFGWPMAAMLRLLGAAAVMAGVAYAVGRAVPGTPGLIAAVALAVPVYGLMVKLFHGLQPNDRARLSMLGKALPGALRGPFQAVVGFVVPAEAGG